MSRNQYGTNLSIKYLVASPCNNTWQDLEEKKPDNNLWGFNRIIRGADDGWPDLREVKRVRTSPRAQGGFFLAGWGEECGGGGWENKKRGWENSTDSSLMRHSYCETEMGIIYH